MRFRILCTPTDSSDKTQMMCFAILLCLFTSKYDMNGNRLNRPRIYCGSAFCAWASFQTTCVRCVNISHFRQPQAQTHSCIKIRSGRTINCTLYDAIHEKKHASLVSKPTDPPKVPQKPNFIVILNAWTWIPMQTVLHELEVFHNYPVIECRKNVPNAIYNAHDRLIKQKHISAQYDEQERACWMRFTIFALPS